jgi:Domain of unknown function (DUF4388)
MQNNRFVVLTGHLSSYPLSDLVGILRHQRKSGRLLIEYPKGPATFFFQNGELMDARMNDLIGLQAICVALAQPEASFNFNPLIQSPRRSIEPSLQRAVSELFGCWEESALQIEGSAEQRAEVLALPPGPAQGLATRGPASLVRQRSMILLAAAVMIVIGLSTAIAVTRAFKNNQVADASLPQTPAPAAPLAVQVQPTARQPAPAAVAKSNRSQIERKEEKRTKPESEPEPEKSPQAIKVVMQIENGRVLQAAVANHKPGMDSYEALALRIARQRRYPATVTGGESVTINVRPE